MNDSPDQRELFAIMAEMAAKDAELWAMTPDWPG